MKAIDHGMAAKRSNDEDGTDRSKPTDRGFGSRACRGGVRSPGQAAIVWWTSFGGEQELLWHFGLKHLALALMVVTCAIHRPAMEVLFDYTLLLC